MMEVEAVEDGMAVKLLETLHSTFSSWACISYWMLGMGVGVEGGSLGVEGEGVEGAGEEGAVVVAAILASLN